MRGIALIVAAVASFWIASWAWVEYQRVVWNVEDTRVRVEGQKELTRMQIEAQLNRNPKSPGSPL